MLLVMVFVLVSKIACLIVFAESTSTTVTVIVDHSDVNISNYDISNGTYKIELKKAEDNQVVDITDDSLTKEMSIHDEKQEAESFEMEKEGSDTADPKDRDVIQQISEGIDFFEGNENQSLGDDKGGTSEEVRVGSTENKSIGLMIGVISGGIAFAAASFMLIKNKINRKR